MNAPADNYSSLISRIEDLPYYFSPPMQFSFSQSADLTLGQYPFTSGRAVMTGNKNITDNTLLYIRAISFAADIPILDYQQALALAGGTVDIPRFYMFLQSAAQSPILVDPLVLHNYFNRQRFRLVIEPKQFPNTISAFFRGTLQQTAALAGITTINLTTQVWLQQITDDNFINGLKTEYPKIIRSR